MVPIAVTVASEQHGFESRREISLRRSVGTVLSGFPKGCLAPFFSSTCVLMPLQLIRDTNRKETPNNYSSLVSTLLNDHKKTDSSTKP